MAGKNWKRMMELIADCESKFGSIKNTPSEYSSFIEIRNLVNQGSKRGIDLSDENQDKIVDQITAGYSLNYIANRFNTTIDTVIKIANLAHVKPKQIFNYTIIRTGMHSYCFSRVKDIEIIAGKELNPVTRKKFLKENNYRLKKVDAVWKNIKIGSKYLLKGQREFLIKYSNDSYGERSRLEG